LPLKTKVHVAALLQSVFIACSPFRLFCPPLPPLPKLGNGRTKADAITKHKEENAVALKKDIMAMESSEEEGGFSSEGEWIVDAPPTL